jgi:hemerythrin-like metal-binding protein/PAS domain S-box-containing protein/diguanylate cyclase (GGDEF)-like protein
MQSIDIFPWNEHFNTGIKKVDEQHHKLVNILNKLAMNVALDGDVEINSIFEELADYTVYHFQTEEAIWHKYFPNDPLDVQHQETHQKFITTVLRLKSEIEAKPSNELAQEVFVYLAKWLASHILESDRYLAYVVLAIEDGATLSQAKIRADEQMRGLTQTLIDVILSIYTALSTKTMELLHTMREHDLISEILEKQKNELETIFNISKDGIAIIDLESNFLEVNNTYVKMTGFSHKELLTKSCIGLSVEKDKERTREVIKNIIKEGSADNFEKTCIFENAREINVSLSMSLMPDKQRILLSTKDITQRKKSQAENEKLLYYDQLTGLPNRQKMKLDMNNTIPYACVIFNINRFQEINDFFGIEAGDSVLVQISNGAKQFGFTPYRIGGDEFAILIYESLTRNEIELWLQNKFTQLNKTKITVSNETVKIVMNVGVALNTDKLLTHADIALHQAKEKKIPFAIYEKDDKIEELYKKNIAMASAIHKALNEGRIICYYQPIVALDTNKTTKYETLVRMLDEDGKIISPIEFLSIAKKTKLYSRITKTVISQACKCFANKDEEFSVNLSIDDINDPLTIQEIIKIIVETNTANRIVFEILESEGIESYDSVIRFIKQVKALGAKIAIDDFGSGYSNFEHILKLNVDYIKIDGSLIKGIASNKRHKIVVETIIDFAKKMGAKTISEFVCDKAVYDVVKSLGVDYSQGYYTGKPEAL